MKIHWKDWWQPTLVFLPGEFLGQRSLVGYSPWGDTESDTTDWLTLSLLGFPGNSAGKQSAWNTGAPVWIPVLGRSPGERIGYPLQCSWVSLVTQTVKNPPAMWETWVRSLGWEDPLEKGMATHSSILAGRIPWTEEPGRPQSMGLQRVGHNWATFTFTWCWGWCSNTLATLCGELTHWKRPQC